MGPICRQRYMVAERVSEEAREEGNKLIYRIALLQHGDEVIRAVARLKELGFASLVKRIQKRIIGRPAVHLSYQGERLYVQARIPSEMWEPWLSALRSIPGRRYEGKEVGNSFPMDQKRSIYELLLKFFPGRRAVGPKGEFTIAA